MSFGLVIFSGSCPPKLLFPRYLRHIKRLSLWGNSYSNNIEWHRKLCIHLLAIKGRKLTKTYDLLKNLLSKWMQFYFKVAKPVIWFQLASLICGLCISLNHLKYCSNGSHIEILGESNLPDLDFLGSSFEWILTLFK